VYESHAVFTTFFPEQWSNTSKGDRDKVGVAFPTFDISSKPDSDSDVGVLSFKGDMTGFKSAAFSWNEFGANVGTGGANSGPIVLFSKDLNTTLVISAYSNFMAHTTEVGDANDLIFGTPGAVESVPAGFRIETVSGQERGDWYG
jgi:hypothetical protein